MLSNLMNGLFKKVFFYDKSPLKGFLTLSKRRSLIF